MSSISHRKSSGRKRSALLARMRDALSSLHHRGGVHAASSSRGVTLLAKAGESLVVRSGDDSRLLCVSGTVWVTQEGDPVDVTLVQGQSASFGRSAMTLVQALTDSVLWMGSAEKAK